MSSNPTEHPHAHRDLKTTLPISRKPACLEELISFIYSAPDLLRFSLLILRTECTFRRVGHAGKMDATAELHRPPLMLHVLEANEVCGYAFALLMGAELVRVY